MSLKEQSTLVVNKKHNRNSFMPKIASKTFEYTNSTSNTNYSNNISNSTSIATNHAVNSGCNTSNYNSQLYRVHGISYPGVGTLSISNEGIVAYPTGCVIVLYDMNKDSFSYIRNSSRKVY